MSDSSFMGMCSWKAHTHVVYMYVSTGVYSVGISLCMHHNFMLFSDCYFVDVGCSRSPILTMWSLNSDQHIRILTQAVLVSKVNCRWACLSVKSRTDGFVLTTKDLTTFLSQPFNFSLGQTRITKYKRGLCWRQIQYNTISLLGKQHMLIQTVNGPWFSELERIYSHC